MPSKRGQKSAKAKDPAIAGEIGARGSAAGATRLSSLRDPETLRSLVGNLQIGRAHV